MKSSCYRPMRLAAAVALSLVALAAVPARAQSDASITGTWRVQVMQFNCLTKAPLSTFQSLLTFASDGTMTESTTNPALLPGQRTGGHGFWNRLGPTSFSVMTEAFITFNSPTTPPGLKTGSQKILQTVVVTGPNTFNAAAAVRFFDSTGALYLKGCASAVGTRLTSSLDQP